MAIILLNKTANPALSPIPVPKPDVDSFVAQGPLRTKSLKRPAPSARPRQAKTS